MLDLGCGYGRILNELIQAGYTNLHGVDPSNKMIERGLKENPSLDLKLQNKIEYPENSIDAIILNGVLTCIVEDHEQVTLISELYRILKTGGILYVSDFLLNSDRRNIDRYTAGNWKYKNFGVFKTEDGAILRHHSTEWIRQLLQNFTLNIYEELLFPTINNNQSNGFYSIGVKDA